MQLTKRDIEIISFINDFGFCETTHICKYFNLQPYLVHRIMKRLIQSELLIKEKIFYGQGAVYRLTNKGAQFTGLPKLDKVPLGTYIHNTKLIDLYLKIKELFPDCIWISERYLRYEKCFDGIGQFRHCADAIVNLSDKRIAIELELTLKTQDRLDKILSGYSAEFSINEVWYFCSKNVLPVLNKKAESINYLKVFDLYTFLQKEAK